MNIINIHQLAHIDLEYRQQQHMFLTHMVHKYPKYAEVATQCKGFKILDNSVIELGSAMDPSLIIDAAKIIGADEVVLPDAYMDGSRTWYLIEENFERFAQELPDTKLMAVVHGRDEEEWMQTLEYILSISEISTIGIPKCTAKMHPRGRSHFIYNVINADPEATKEIHLLGLQYSFRELYELSGATQRCIRSCDTILGEYFDATNTVFRPDGWTLDLETGEVVRGH